MCGIHFIDFLSVSSHIPSLILTKSELSLVLLITFIFNLKPRVFLDEPGTIALSLSLSPFHTLVLPLSPQGLSGSSCCLSWGIVLLPSKLHWENLKTAVAEQQGPDGSATGAALRAAQSEREAWRRGGRGGEARREGGEEVTLRLEQQQYRHSWSRGFRT